MSTGKKRLLAYIMMILSLIISTKLLKDIVKLSQIDNRLIEAEADLEIEKQQQGELIDRLKKSETNELWEKRVRDTLKMARNNEVVVVIPEEINKSDDKEEKFEEIKEEELSIIEKWVKIFVY